MEPPSFLQSSSFHLYFNPNSLCFFVLSSRFPKHIASTQYSFPHSTLATTSGLLHPQEKHRHISRSVFNHSSILLPAMSSQDTRSMSQRLRPRRPSTFLTLAPIISGAEQKPKAASADEAALDSPTESVKQVEAESAEALKRRASSVSSQSSTTGGFRFLRNH